MTSSSDNSGINRACPEKIAEELMSRLDDALSQLAGDICYHEEYPKVGQTLDSLTTIELLAPALADSLSSLSPVALAALHDGGFKHARDEVPKLIPILALIGSASRKAADLVKASHSAFSDGGQGSGSAMGRDVDLAAVALHFGQTPVWPPARQPTHKFGATVLFELVAGGREDIALASPARLTALLDWLWYRKDFPDATPSWSVVLKNKRNIVQSAREEIVRSEERRRARAARRRRAADPSSSKSIR